MPMVKIIYEYILAEGSATSNAALLALNVPLRSMSITKAWSYFQDQRQLKKTCFESVRGEIFSWA